MKLYGLPEDSDITLENVALLWLNIYIVVLFYIQLEVSPFDLFCLQYCMCIFNGIICAYLIFQVLTRAP